MKKYELIKESKTMFEGIEIYRIRALKDFSDVRTGDIGGWVCSEDNLSQNGNCWIYDNAKCLDDARILDNAKMFDNAEMYDNSVMYDNTRMLDNAEIYGNAKMYDNSRMSGNARMYDDAVMYDYTILDKNKILYGSINKSYKKIFQHHCERRLLTAILTEENEILYSVGCQIGMTKEEFIDRIYNDCGVMGKGLMGKGLEEYPHRQEYLDIIDMAENYLMKFI